MNLLQASYFKVQNDLHAGGPGSGRHISNSAHKELIGKGYKFTGNRRGMGFGTISHYEHPTKGSKFTTPDGGVHSTVPEAISHLRSINEEETD